MPAVVSQTPFCIELSPDFLDGRSFLRRSASQLARHYAAGRFVTENALKAVGLELWHALDIEAEFEAARKAAGTQTLPIQIMCDAAAVHQLPWETLYHPEFGFLGKANGFTLSRSLPAKPSEPAAPPKGPLRVLLFTSLPDDVDPEKSRLDVEEDQAQILEALTPWIANGMVALEMPDDGRFATLQHFLKEFEPHLLFLSGHGKFVDQPHNNDTPFGIFQFESETGSSDFVHEDTLANAFLGSAVSCVVLSACESGMTASDSLSNGLMWRLAQVGIPHVVGMREAVMDRAATLFTRHFCDALARQERVDVALQQGRAAITKPLKDSPQLKLDAGGLAEKSMGQWCLPLLISRDSTYPLIDWDFAPQPAPPTLIHQTLEDIVLPPRFVGRRTELREIKSQLRQNKLQQLLITGPGGQGKTALAGKLAQDLERRGYLVLAYSARPENIWQHFFIKVIRHLTPHNRADFSSMQPYLEDEPARADYLLRLLLRQNENRVLLFLDNLESIQDPKTHALTDARLLAWLQAGQKLCGRGLILLLTSRWRLPDWPRAAQRSLAHANYGDFLQMARRELPPTFLQDRERLRQVYDTLHGNGRGLTFFAAAIQNMDVAAETAFLEKLAQATAETQTDMALALIVAHLAPAAVALMTRLPAYQTPVPLEGIIKLGLDLPDPEQLLQQLLAVSLVEPQMNPALDVVEFQLSPLVTAWLPEQNFKAPDQALLTAAAGYLWYLFRNENKRRTLPQTILVHQALHTAGEIETAHRFALDWIVGPLNRQGLYQTLLDEWLPPICTANDLKTQAEAIGQTGKQHLHLGNYQAALPYMERSLKIRQEIGDKSGEGTTLNNISQIYDARGDYDTALAYLQRSLKIWQEIGDKSGEGTTLNNISQIFKARGDYDTALAYLQRSLKISQEIGDVAGLCATLFNMGHIHWQNEEVPQALSAWVTVYQLAQPRQLAQALAALENLAGQLGLSGGLAAWAQLAQQRGPNN